MSNNKIYEIVHGNMLTLGLTTAESILDNWLDSASERNLTMIEVLDHLMEQEVSRRRESAIKTRTKIAGFPVKKYLKDYDLEFQKSIDKKVLDELKTMRFVHSATNLIILGAPGVGKTHIAIGLGMEAINAGFSVYFINSASMIAKLKSASRRDNLEKKLKTFNKYKLLIIDEIGYLPFDAEASNLFFRLISKRYEHAPTILARRCRFEYIARDKLLFDLDGTGGRAKACAESLVCALYPGAGCVGDLFAPPTPELVARQG